MVIAKCEMSEVRLYLENMTYVWISHSLEFLNLLKLTRLEPQIEAYRNFRVQFSPFWTETETVKFRMSAFEKMSKKFTFFAEYQHQLLFCQRENMKMNGKTMVCLDWDACSWSILRRHKHTYIYIHNDIHAHIYTYTYIMAYMHTYIHIHT